MKILANLTIRSRLTVNAIVIAVALVALFLLMVSSSSRMSELAHTMADVEKLSAQVLTLRRNEKDFLARKDLKYVDRFAGNVQKLNANVSNLKSSTQDLGIDAPELNTFGRVANEYADKFKQLSEFQQVIGLHPKDGYYGELRAAVHSVEELLNWAIKHWNIDQVPKTSEIALT